MTYRQHVTIGILVYFIAVVPLIGWILFRHNWSAEELARHWWELLICFVLCLLGAMAPDIDVKSRSQRVIYTILILVDLGLILFGYYRSAAAIGFLAMLPNILKHRGGIHSFPAALILPAPLLFIPILATGKLEYQQVGVTYYIAAVIGYISHLIADGKRYGKRR